MAPPASKPLTTLRILSKDEREPAAKYIYSANSILDSRWPPGTTSRPPPPPTPPLRHTTCQLYQLFVEKIFNPRAAPAFSFFFFSVSRFDTYVTLNQPLQAIKQPSNSRYPSDPFSLAETFSTLPTTNPFLTISFPF
jgi:hypothetical protein